MTFLQIGAYVGVATALTSTFGGAAYYLDALPIIKKEFIQYQQQQQLTFEQLQAQQLQTYQSFISLRAQFLIDKTKYAPLTFLEQNELCQLADQLKWNRGVPGC